jgi:dTDP-4-dehydrorhamnose 3,5-epimerase
VQVEPLDIPGAWLVTPSPHPDERGTFLEWLRADVLEERTGQRFEVAQANVSISHRDVLRGVHLCQVPPGQAKYVTCVAGAVLDVLVDLRVGSATFGMAVPVRLDTEDRRAVYLPLGVGHAFLALAEGATLVYLQSAPHQPDLEFAVHPFDPDLALPWPPGISPRLSPRDAAAPRLAEVGALLPRWADCLPDAAAPGAAAGATAGAHRRIGQ